MSPDPRPGAPAAPPGRHTAELVVPEKATVAVIVASLIAAALLGLFDVFWQFLTDKIQNPSL